MTGPRVLLWIRLIVFARCKRRGRHKLDHHIATNKATSLTFAMMRYDVVICKVGRPQLNLRING